MRDSRVDAVVAEVREGVVPDQGEQATLERVVEDLLDRARTAVAELPVEADVVHVGSTARGTWTRGDRDIDVFVRFPPDLPRDRLEEFGLQVGHHVLPEGYEAFAEHPYVTGDYRGFGVDLVPCYRVEDATANRSAVDRTPFHDRYLGSHLNDRLRGDVRVCKAFLKGIGVYGSNLRTEGFSGYLTELLVLAFDGFQPLVEAAADWHPPVRLDPGGTDGDEGFDHPLVVVDPTDPDRNVAAVLSADNLARFQHYARDLLDDPRPELFAVTEPEPLTASAVRAHVERRASTPVAIRFATPSIVDDQLYPQLRKSLTGITGELDRRGFEVLRATHFSGEAETALFVECAVADLPAVERHKGPPVQVRDHATEFYEQYVDDPDVYGPYIDAGRYVVERERGFSSVRALLESDQLFNVSLGPDIADALRNGYEVAVGDDVAGLADPFGVELAQYFDPRP